MIGENYPFWERNCFKLMQREISSLFFFLGLAKPPNASHGGGHREMSQRHL